MKTHRAHTALSNRRASLTRLGFACLTAAALSVLGTHGTQAAVITWTGAAGDNNFSTAGNYTPVTTPSGNTVLFGTNSAVSNPTTFTTTTILQLGFQGAGWKIGTTSGAGQTLTLSGNPLALSGIGTGSYLLASTGAGTNEIAPNVAITGSNGSPVFVDAGNTLKLDGTLTTGGAFNLSGTGTLTVGGVFTSAGVFTSITGATLSAAGYAGGTQIMNLGAVVIPSTTGTTASTFNVTGGTFAAGTLNIGTGSLNIGSAVTTFASGNINLTTGGTLTLANSSANDIGTAVTTTVAGNAKLVFDNSINNVGRINTPSSTNAITLNGGELGLIGNTAATTAQSAYLVFNGTSASTLTLTPSAGQLTSLTNANTTNNLTAANAVGGTLLVRGTNLGQAAGQTAGEAQVFLTTTPTLIGGLLPYAIGDNSTTGQGSTFLTYNGTTGLTPVASTASTILAAAAGTNVLQNADDATQTANKTINSLLVNGGGSGLTTTIANGTTLTLASGDYLAAASTNGNVLTGGTLAAGGRLYLFVQDGAAATDLTVNTALNTGNSLTKSGAGTMLLNMAVTGNGTVAVAQGTLQLGGANVLGTGNTGNQIYVGYGGTLDLNGFNLTQGATTGIPNTNNQTSQSGQITNTSATASTITTNVNTTIYEHIAGNIAVTVNAGTLGLSAVAAINSPLTNTYTGNTTINTGGTLLTSDVGLGAFSNTLIFNGGTFNPSNNTTFSAARNISITANGGTLIADANTNGSFTDTYNGTFLAPAGTPTFTLQAGSGGAKAGLSSALVFANTGGNDLAPNLNVVLNATAANTPLTANFASNQSFGSLASGTGTFGANTALTAGSTGVVFTTGGNNLSTAYNGVITNGTGTSASLVKNGTGTLTLSGANGYTGGTTINAGSISLTGGSAASSTAATSVTAGTSSAPLNTVTLTSGTTAGLVFGQTVSGAGIPAGAYITSTPSSTTFTISAAITTTGTPTVTIGAYSGLGTGAVTVNGGSLSLGSATALQSNTNLLTVSGGTLTSTVANTTLGGNLTMTSGAISPGGTNVGMLTLSAGRTFTMSGGTLNLNLGTAFDQIVGGTNFNITGGTLALDTTGAGFSYASNYNVLSGFTGTNTVSGLAFTGYDNTNYQAMLDTTGVLSFTMIAVPEPSTWVAGVGMCLLLAGRIIRRRRAA